MNQRSELVGAGFITLSGLAAAPFLFHNLYRIPTAPDGLQRAGALVFFMLYMASTLYSALSLANLWLMIFAENLSAEDYLCLCRQRYTFLTWVVNGFHFAEEKDSNEHHVLPYSQKLSRLLYNVCRENQLSAHMCSLVIELSDLKLTRVSDDLTQRQDLPGWLSAHTLLEIMATRPSLYLRFGWWVMRFKSSLVQALHFSSLYRPF